MPRRNHPAVKKQGIKHTRKNKEVNTESHPEIRPRKSVSLYKTLSPESVSVLRSSGLI